MKILIDNAWGAGTLFRRSPDRTFYEWRFNREIAIGVVDKLCDLGYDAERIVLEDDFDVPIAERARRANKFCGEEGKGNVILISIRGMRGDENTKCEWIAQRGITATVNRGSSEESKELARYFMREARSRGYVDNKKKTHFSEPFKCYKEELRLLSLTICPAIITENLCYCNKDDLNMLKNEFTYNEIIDIHVQSIDKYIKRNEPVVDVYLHPDIKETDKQLLELKERLIWTRKWQERDNPIAVYL